MFESYRGQTLQILGLLEDFFLVVDFRIPKLVNVCPSSSEHPIMKKKKKKEIVNFEQEFVPE